MFENFDEDSKKSSSDKFKTFDVQLREAYNKDKALKLQKQASALHDVEQRLFFTFPPKWNFHNPTKRNIQMYGNEISFD